MPLHELRAARNLTQQQLAKTLDMTKAAVSQLEQAHGCLAWRPNLDAKTDSGDGKEDKQGAGKRLRKLVDLDGFEPSTSFMPFKKYQWLSDILTENKRT